MSKNIFLNPSASEFYSATFSFSDYADAIESSKYKKKMSVKQFGSLEFSWYFSASMKDIDKSCTNDIKSCTIIVI